MAAKRSLSVMPLLLFAGLLARSAAAAAPAIDDGGRLFSDAALAQGNRIVREIYEDTAPRKDVIIETFRSLPPDMRSVDELARRAFREREIDGILIVAVKEPGTLRVAVGRRTAERFSDGDRERLVEILLGKFREKRFDEGLAEGLGFVKQKLTAAFPAPGVERVPERERTSPVSGGMPLWLWAALIFAGVWVVLALVRARSQASSAAGPGYPPPAGYGSGGYGGGWGQSILGGLFGAMAGNWLYDRFARGGDEAHAGREEPIASDQSQWSDDGQIGGVSGGDFGDDVADAGDTSDFGDGGDSGGGDGGGDF
jgi:uncharacterized membrane protein YgcG